MATVWERDETVTMGALSFLVMLATSWLLDRAVRPRRRGGRQWRGWVFNSLATIALFGLILAGSGSSAAAALLAIALMALLMLASNAKYAMLGEPLLFSDLALIGWVFRHPRFYLTALSAPQRWMLGLGIPILLLGLVGSFVPRWAPHLVGFGLLAAGLAALGVLSRSPLFDTVARAPDIDADLANLGLIATLLFYWARWREAPDPALCPPLDQERTAGDASAHPVRPALILIVQCESFADPVALTGNADLALPGLARARAGAWQWGDLKVSGFGAYTMRTEYGVLFGRSEEALGFRRFDPFLTALGETSYALPARLRREGYRSLFVHPHDMRFYGRDRLMPAIGFDRLIGEERFPPIPPGGGRYIDDRTLGEALGELIETAAEPTLVYAVTMENHGPWIRDRVTGSDGGLDAYLHHLSSSDTMLSELVERLSGAKRPAMLVFFGDHRPSIPGVTKPGGDRHTPYVMIRFAADGRLVPGEAGPVDLTPDELHHAVLNSLRFG